jgi:hypothetical protein
MNCKPCRPSTVDASALRDVRGASRPYAVSVTRVGAPMTAGQSGGRDTARSGWLADRPIRVKLGLPLVAPVAASFLAECSSIGDYPCRPRWVAERVVAASAVGWPHRWAARYDALSCGLSPSADAAGVTARPGPDRGRRD